MNIFKINLTRWSLIFLALATQPIKSEMVLDESFGMGGAIELLGENIEELQNIGFLSDGKIITLSHRAREFFLSRYNTTTGLRDVTFGQDGTGSIELLPKRPHSLLKNFRVALNDTITIASIGDKEEFHLKQYDANGSEISDQNALLKRILTWLTDDTNCLFLPERTTITALAIQPNDKIIIIGSVLFGQRSSFIARYNTDGTLDDTFGPDGNGIIINTEKVCFDSITLQSDSKIIVATNPKQLPSADNASILRYNGNGTLDRSFGLNGNGIVYDQESRIDSMAVQHNNKLIVAKKRTHSDGNITEVLRYNSDATPDATFGPHGNTIGLRIRVDAWNHAPHIKLITVQSDDKILIVQRHPNMYGIMLSRYKLVRPDEIEERGSTASTEIKECPICCDEIQHNNLAKTQCNHFFHSDCLQRWTTSGQNGANKCPLCRTDIPSFIATLATLAQQQLLIE